MDVNAAAACCVVATGITTLELVQLASVTVVDVVDAVSVNAPTLVRSSAMGVIMTCAPPLKSSREPVVEPPSTRVNVVPDAV
jgi:hypothetical protein